ncbi:hypothetical protein, conserved [Eimeria acervulina]|uniref:Uncharacterized protein n=1 Tax=Eimeria acervulina TaxID=5801 RepID=U6GD69_EIMAC|nr:hypothetical protein, conserved [Eimeria acervulina]CDI78070.1 hypothetical protein, conserved [Eimeria acervulina]
MQAENPQKESPLGGPQAGAPVHVVQETDGATTSNIRTNYSSSSSNSSNSISNGVFSAAAITSKQSPVTQGAAAAAAPALPADVAAAAAAAPAGLADVAAAAAAAATSAPAADSAVSAAAGEEVTAAAAAEAVSAAAAATEMSAAAAAAEMSAAAAAEAVSASAAATGAVSAATAADTEAISSSAAFTFLGCELGREEDKPEAPWGPPECSRTYRKRSRGPCSNAAEKTRFSEAAAAGAAAAETEEAETEEAETAAASSATYGSRRKRFKGSAGSSNSSSSINSSSSSNNNSLMHPRSRFFGGPLNFQKLAEEAPDLHAFIIKSRNKKEATFDFHSREAQLSLCIALFRCIYSLSFSLPLHHNLLIPALPNRSNYIHFLADLLSPEEGLASPRGPPIPGGAPYLLIPPSLAAAAAANEADTQHVGAPHQGAPHQGAPNERSGGPPRGPQVRIMDIGVGGNCVYPLLGVSDYSWSFVGSDISELSLSVAEENVRANKYEVYIQLRQQQQQQQIFKGVVFDADPLFAASVCNPPFYANEESVGINPRREKGGRAHELICEGGEEAFLRCMYTESKQFARHFIWFTSLVARASTRNQIKRLIQQGMRQAGIKQKIAMDKHLQTWVSKYNSCSSNCSSSSSNNCNSNGCNTNNSNNETSTNYSNNTGNTSNVSSNSSNSANSSSSSSSSSEVQEEVEMHPRELRVFDLFQGKQTRWVVCWTFWTADQRRVLRQLITKE